MAELVDAADLKSAGFIHRGSSPLSPTTESGTKHRCYFWLMAATVRCVDNLTKQISTLPRNMSLSSFRIADSILAVRAGGKGSNPLMIYETSAKSNIELVK